MPKRCSDTHFYVSGHKTRSGRASYTAPDGAELVVVCGRNRPGPGQIHLRDVPDGAALRVSGAAGSLTLALDRRATRGRRGRVQMRSSLEHDRDEYAEGGWLSSDTVTMIRNLAAELPPLRRDYRSTEYRSVALWYTRLLESRDGGPELEAALRADVFDTNLHSYLGDFGWGVLVRTYERDAYDDEVRLPRLDPTAQPDRSQTDPTARIDRLANVLATRLAELRAAGDLGALRATVTELLGIHYARPLSPGAEDRLVSCLAAGRVDERLLDRFMHAASNRALLEFAVQTTSARNRPDASWSRQAGLRCAAVLLRIVEQEIEYRNASGGIYRYYVPFEWWAVQVLAEPALAPLGDQAAALLGPEWRQLAEAVATPPGHAALARRSWPDASERHLARPGDAPTGPRAATGRRRERLPGALRDVAVPAPSSGTGAGRDGRLDARQRSAIDALTECVVPLAPPAGTIPTAAIFLDRVLQLHDAGVARPVHVRRLLDADVRGDDVHGYRSVGVHTVSQMVAHAEKGVWPYHVEGYDALGITAVHDRMVYARAGVGPDELAVYRHLGGHDDQDIRRLRRAGVTPAERAAFVLAGLDCAATVECHADGISGMAYLEMVTAGIVERAEQHRVCAAYPDARVVTALVRLGYTDRALLAAASEHLDSGMAEELARLGVEPSRYAIGVDSGLDAARIAEYARAEIFDPADWRTLFEAGVHGSTDKLRPRPAVTVYRAAGLDTAAAMATFATAGLVELDDVLAHIERERQIVHRPYRSEMRVSVSRALL